MNADVVRVAYRPAEVGEALGVSRSKAYELIASGAIRSILVGNSRRVPAECLRQFVEQQLEASAAK